MKRLLVVAGVAACATVPVQSRVSAPTSEMWFNASPLLHPRSAHAVVSTRDRIYVLGGTGEGGAPVRDVEVFDGDAWTVESQLPGEGLNAPAAVAIDARIYLIGGFGTTTNVPTSNVLVYDVRTQTWSEAAPLPAPRGGHAAVLLNGKIHVIGGGNSASTLSDHSEYDPATDTWVARAPLPRSEGSPAAVAYEGKLYAIGGRSGPSDFGDVYVYDPATDRWNSAPSIVPRGTAGAAVYCNAIYVFGGESQATKSTLTEVLRLDPASKSWVETVPMLSARNYARATVASGDVYLIGGNPTVGPSHSASGSTLVERFHAVCP